MPQSTNNKKEKQTDIVADYPAETIAATAAYIRAREALKHIGKEVPKLARSGQVLKKVGPVATATFAAVDTAHLAASEEARRQATEEAEEMADSDALSRLAGGFFSPVKTGYGIATAVNEQNDLMNKELVEAAEPDSRYLAKKKKAAMIKKARTDDASFVEAVERRLNRQA